MKKVDLGQTITILANFGVIAGIVFLAIELHQNNELLEAQARYNHKETRAGYSEIVATNKELAEVLDKNQQGQSLTSAEQMQVDEYYTMAFASFEWEYFESLYDRFQLPLTGYRNFFRNRRGARELYERRKVSFTPEFRRFMDEQILSEE